MTQSSKKYKISISLNILNHLGINLYSTVPAVLSEVVANAWDADASQVDITINKEEKIITIIDDGHGMSPDDLNNKYLKVGLQRRKKDESLSLNKNRPVMGRKGIGKLSLFSIADTVEVYSVKDDVKSGLIMNRLNIEKAISIEDDATSQDYHPTEVLETDIDMTSGTKIILKDLRKKVGGSSPYLRTRLARLFAIIGQQHGFNVSIDGKKISNEDRNYIKNIQYLWLLGEDKNNYSNQVKDAVIFNDISNIFEYEGVEYEFSGWIGTVKEASETRDNEGESINNISIIVRGKSAQVDILNELGDTGIYTKYIIGEVHADFLDDDNLEDIATTSRQKLIEDNPRYQVLKIFIKGALKEIKRNWTDLRNTEGKEVAILNPIIEKWFQSLEKDEKETAKNIFGKINQMHINKYERDDLFAHSVLVVENFKYKKNLLALNNMEITTSESMEILKTIFKQTDDIEAALYYRITKERMSIVKILQKMIEENEIEKNIQEYLFEHLWLLDPSWERSTKTPLMEESISKRFKGIDADLTDDERKGRIDIKYMTSAGNHIIIELKRPNVKTNCLTLLSQVDKYRTALKKYLKLTNENDPPISTICILGEMPIDYNAENHNTLKSKDIRLTTYIDLLNQAFSAYEKYQDENKKVVELVELVDSLIK